MSYYLHNISSSIDNNDMLSQASENAVAKSGLVQKLGDIVDRYGAAYFLSARFVGVTIVFSLYGGLK
jgi:hypothetical protein